MILSDRTIREAIAAGRIRIEPFDDSQVQPASVDVRLDRYFRVFLNHTMPVIDVKQNLEELTELVEIDDDHPFVLHPGEFVLGATLERIALAPDVVGRVEGKALALDTEIPTTAGWKTMGELEPGDLVFHPDGFPTPVVAATDVMVGRPCYRVTFSDGTDVVADASHQWFTRDKADREAGRLGAIRTTEEIAGRVWCSDREYNHRVDVTAPIHYPTKALPIDPYVLGAWIGDGTSAAAQITCADEPILRELELCGYRVSKASGPLAYRVGGEGATRDPVSGQFCRNGSLSSQLRNLDLLGNEHIPERYMTADAGQRQSLLEGLMDTDGYVDKWGRCEFTTIRRGRAIVSVEPVDSVPVRCIQVGDTSGLYVVARSFIPTHNSSLGRLGLLIHSTAGFVDPGWHGNITLELSNVANLPITLYPGMKIGQISFLQMTTPADVPYGADSLKSKYQGQRGPTPSRYWENFSTD